MTPAGPRAAAAEVFAALASHEVRYCIWRGTPRLERAFAGESDFDLLVDAGQADRLPGLLASLGARRGRPLTEPIPGLEDWFGLAGPCGPLLHYHVHYRLVAGEPRHARYHLPFEQQVLDSRLRLPGSELFVADPVVESALLLLRSALQLRGRDRLPGTPAAGRIVAKVHSDLERLLPFGRAGELPGLLHRWLGRDPGLAPGELPRLGAAGLWRLRAAAGQALHGQTPVHGLRAWLRTWGKELRAGLRVLARRWRLPMLPARGGARGGLLVALEGADGASRSQLAGRLARLFGGKFDVFLAQDERQLPRAMVARRRGMLAVAGLARADWPSWCVPDLVVRLSPAGQEPQAVLADVIAAVWDRL